MVCWIEFRQFYKQITQASLSKSAIHSCNQGKNDNFFIPLFLTIFLVDFFCTLTVFKISVFCHCSLKLLPALECHWSGCQYEFGKRAYVFAEIGIGVPTRDMQNWHLELEPNFLSPRVRLNFLYPISTRSAVTCSLGRWTRGLHESIFPSSFRPPLTKICWKRDAVLKAKECLYMVWQWLTTGKNS